VCASNLLLKAIAVVSLAGDNGTLIKQKTLISCVIFQEMRESSILPTTGADLESKGFVVSKGPI